MVFIIFPKDFERENFILALKKITTITFFQNIEYKIPQTWLVRFGLPLENKYNVERQMFVVQDYFEENKDEKKKIQIKIQEYDTKIHLLQAEKKGKIETRSNPKTTRKKEKEVKKENSILKLKMIIKQ